MVYQVFYKSAIFKIQNDKEDQMKENYENICIFYIVEVSLVTLGVFINIFVDKI